MNRNQLDLFVADFLDVAPKGDIDTMEAPVYSLSTKPDLAVWRFEMGDVFLEVMPSQAGRPTIFDKDLLMYCISQVAEGMNRGRPLTKRVQITAYAFLKSTARGTSGRDYEALLASIQRLRGVTITTNIRAKSRRAHVRGLIDSADIIESDQKGRMVSIQIELSDWILDAVSNKQILTYSSDYYRLRKPNERRLYEICRKFCGTQESWMISEEKLYRRFGTRSNEREFRRTLKEMVEAQNIPDYRIEYDSKEAMFYAYYMPGKTLSKPN